MTKTIAELVLALLTTLIALRLFSARLKLPIKLLINAAGGFLLLTVFHLLGDTLHIQVGINALTVGTVTLLGLPGFALLVLAQWLFR